MGIYLFHLPNYSESQNDITYPEYSFQDSF